MKDLFSPNLNNKNVIAREPVCLDCQHSCDSSCEGTCSYSCGESCNQTCNRSCHSFSGTLLGN